MYKKYISVLVLSSTLVFCTFAMQPQETVLKEQILRLEMEHANILSQHAQLLRLAPLNSDELNQQVRLLQTINAQLKTSVETLKLRAAGIDPDPFELCKMLD